MKRKKKGNKPRALGIGDCYVVMDKLTEDELGLLLSETGSADEDRVKLLRKMQEEVVDTAIGVMKKEGVELMSEVKDATGIAHQQARVMQAILALGSELPWPTFDSTMDDLLPEHLDCVARLGVVARRLSQGEAMTERQQREVGDLLAKAIRYLHLGSLGLAVMGWEDAQRQGIEKAVEKTRASVESWLHEISGGTTH
jgi:hypothetical protein